MGLGTEIALIKALGGGSGALPPITDEDNGKVLTANSGVWGASKRRSIWRSDPLVQVIPITYENGSFSTTVKPQDIVEGYTVDGVTYPKYEQSLETRIRLEGVADRIAYPDDTSVDGLSFQSTVIPLDNLGLTGFVGVFELVNQGYSVEYRIALYAWQASVS